LYRDDFLVLTIFFIFICAGTMRRDEESSEDEDEEEMKALRDSARARGSRAEGSTRSNPDGPPDLGDDAFVPRSTKPSRMTVSEELDETEEAAVNDDLRLSFPIGFGKMKNTQSLEQVHASTRRPGLKESTLEKMVKEAEAASKGLHLNQSSAGGEESVPAEPNDSDESEDESDDDGDSFVKKITDCVPCSHEAILKVYSSGTLLFFHARNQ
jgi:hypothetical protein